MIKCYKDKKTKDGVIVEFGGDAAEITSDFVCIASKMLHLGIPLVILVKSLMIATEHKYDWGKNKND